MDISQLKLNNELPYRHISLKSMWRHHESESAKNYVITSSRLRWNIIQSKLTVFGATVDSNADLCLLETLICSSEIINN